MCNSDENVFVEHNSYSKWFATPDLNVMDWPPPSPHDVGCVT